MDPRGDFAYFGTHLPGKVVRIDLADFRRVDALKPYIPQWDAHVAGLRGGVMHPDGHFAYYGTPEIPGWAVGVDLVSFATAGHSPPYPGADDPAGPTKRALLIDPGGAHAYFGTATGLAKFDLLAGQPVFTGKLEMDPSFAPGTAAVMDPAGEFAYVATGSRPGGILKIDLETFEHVDTLTPRDDFLREAVIDPTGEFAYFTTYVSQEVLKIDLAEFTHVDTLSPPGATPRAAAIDPTGEFAYITTFGQHTAVQRIDLATFSVVGTAILELGDTPEVAVIDPDGVFLYLGGNGRVIKVAVGQATPPPEPGSIAGSVTDAVTGVAIQGATIILDAHQAVADANGAYQIAGLEAGTYTVTADAEGYEPASQDNVEIAQGAVTTVDFNLHHIKTNEPPVAAFSVLCVALTCTFSDESTDPDGYIVAWAWDFGDGATSVEQHPMHTFTAGAYTVTLTVTDNDGATRSVDKPVTVVAETGYEFGGFRPPINSLPVVNQAKAGSAVPVKFSLGGDHGLDILKAGYPRSVPAVCPAEDAIGGPIEETVVADASRLMYDAETEQYVYVWKTNKNWSGKCRELQLMLDDGSLHTAFFDFR
jgi:PKD repeat protein